MAGKGPRRIGAPKTGAAWLEQREPLDWVDWKVRFRVEVPPNVRNEIEQTIRIYHANAAFSKQDPAISFALASAGELSRLIGVGEENVLPDSQATQASFLRNDLHPNRVLDVVEDVREVDAFRAAVLEIRASLAGLGCDVSLSSGGGDYDKQVATAFEEFVCDALRYGGYPPKELMKIRKALKVKD